MLDLEFAINRGPEKENIGGIMRTGLAGFEAVPEANLLAQIAVNAAPPPLAWEAGTHGIGQICLLAADLAHVIQQHAQGVGRPEVAPPCGSGAAAGTQRAQQAVARTRWHLTLNRRVRIEMCKV